MRKFKMVLWLAMIFVAWFVSLMSILINVATAVVVVALGAHLVIKIVVVVAATTSALACAQLADRLLQVKEPDFD
jgi:hypothetical protein